MNKETELEIEKAIQVLKSNGYLVNNLFHENDIQELAKELIQRILSEEELEKVIQLLSSTFDAEFGINNDQISYCIKRSIDTD